MASVVHNLFLLGPHKILTYHRFLVESLKNSLVADCSETLIRSSPRGPLLHFRTRGQTNDFQSEKWASQWKVKSELSSLFKSKLCIAAMMTFPVFLGFGRRINVWQCWRLHQQWLTLLARAQLSFVKMPAAAAAARSEGGEEGSSVFLEQAAWNWEQPFANKRRHWSRKTLGIRQSAEI